MEISGKIIQVLPLQTGVAKNSGNPWQSQSYVLETQEQFPKRVCFEVFGEQRIKDNPCQLDDIVTVSFDIESREFNGRWYRSGGCSGSGCTGNTCPTAGGCAGRTGCSTF